MPYWNSGTSHGHLQTIIKEGVHDHRDVVKGIANSAIVPNSTDASKEVRLAVLEHLLDFMKNHVELAYTFLFKMAYVEKDVQLFHNDLLPTNLMFHFVMMDDLHRVFINVIDWRRAARPAEKVHLQYEAVDELAKEEVVAVV